MKDSQQGQKFTPDDLLKKLKLRGQIDPQVTKNVILAKLEDKDDKISSVKYITSIHQY